jgi:Protein of unknown function (DUF3237)
MGWLRRSQSESIAGVARLLAAGKVDFQPDHHHIGPAPDEIILHYVIASGALHGPRIELDVVANYGQEWDMVRGDGIIAFESRQLLRSPTGALVFATFSGLYDVGDDGYVDALDDMLTSKVPAEFVVRFYAAAQEYRWLNRELFVGHGERDFSLGTFGLQIFALPLSHSSGA